MDTKPIIKPQTLKLPPKSTKAFDKNLQIEVADNKENFLINRKI